MSARFYKGASLKVTHTNSQQGKVAPPQKNSMLGLTGYIKTKQDPSSSGLASSKGVGVKRGGPIGHKGSSDRSFDAKAFGGSSDKSYFGSSTATPGKVVSNKAKVHRAAVDQRDSGKRSGGSHNPGIHSTVQGRGKMESLRGKAKFSMEK